LRTAGAGAPRAWIAAADVIAMNITPNKKNKKGSELFFLNGFSIDGG